MEGSSPLSRGIRLKSPSLSQRIRIIPALAGNTRSKKKVKHSPTDHPRSRGEYGRHIDTQIYRLGSSPLSRGIRPPARYLPRQAGIIPALAGNTVTQAVTLCSASDHPRSRGEYLREIRDAAANGGSSPLSRGIRMIPTPSEWLGRIIPALAGNTAALDLPGTDRQDHPRSRGEYDVAELSAAPLPGSSPLSRGIPGQPARRRSGPGIIPALAGNT